MGAGTLKPGFSQQASDIQKSIGMRSPGTKPRTRVVRFREFIGAQVFSMRIVARLPGQFAALVNKAALSHLGFP